MKHELLSPAGDAECLEMALEYGCDAVYLGGRAFGMRAGAKNFDPAQLADAVRLAHAKGVKVYLTCNTVPTNDEADAYPAYISAAAECGIDAAIVADLGVMAMTKKYAPGLDIHMSTQVGVMNFASANELYRLGAKRVVLARETSIKDIKRIRENTPEDLEIEVFVHGAMCVSFSGRCLLSKYLAGRDANRGLCAQPCRWKYYLTEETRPGELYEMTEDERGTYILNAKDLCMIEHLDDLIDAGVTSFKIEGRAKSAFYSAVVTNAYRKALDCCMSGEKLPEWVLPEVYMVSHRHYCTGFYYDKDNADMFYDNSGYYREYDFAGVVESCTDGAVFAVQRNHFSLDDELLILSPGLEPVKFEPKEMFGEDGVSIRTARHAMEKLKLPYERSFPERSLILRKK